MSQELAIGDEELMWRQFFRFRVLAGIPHLRALPSMFVKLTRSGGHTYAQLAGSFRNPVGKPQRRTIATTFLRDVGSQ
jgi:hypothetical protein